MNMSYCRFENTSSDLGACLKALRDMEKEEVDSLSTSEIDAAKTLVAQCLRVIATVTGEDVYGPDDVKITDENLANLVDELQEGCQLAEDERNEEESQADF